MKFKTIFSVFALSICICSVSDAAGLRLGMTGAVKQKVKELDKKVTEHKAAELRAKSLISATLFITSVKQNTSPPLSPSPHAMRKGTYKGASAPGSSFTVAPTTAFGWINSGFPDYIKVTLKQILVRYDFGDQIAWSGSKELTMDGSGNIDTSGMTLILSTHTMTKVNLTFATEAKIKGTLTAMFNIAPSSVSHNEVLKTFYTKAAYPYDAVAHTGGAADFTPFETGPAEEASVSVGSDASETVVELPILSGEIDISSPTLTILVDLNRMLRFYDGLNEINHGGVGPADLADKAYFFSDSTFRGSIAAFLGTPGTIQGYQTEFAAYYADKVIPEGVPGWMTIMFDAQGNFLSGLLMGDDDNSLTIAKGPVDSYSDSGQEFVYSIGAANGVQRIFQVNNFVRQTTLNSASPVATWIQTQAESADAVTFHGEAIFTLLFQR